MTSYIKFIEKQAIVDEDWWIHNMNGHSVLSWMGRTFEIICIYKDKFKLTDDYLRRLQERRATFINTKRVRKAVVNTLVTTFGLSNPTYSSFVHSEITMEDLFPR